MRQAVRAMASGTGSVQRTATSPLPSIDNLDEMLTDRLFIFHGLKASVVSVSGGPWVELRHGVAR